MRAPLNLVAVLALTIPMPLFAQWGYRKVDLGTLGLIEVPRRARLDKPGMRPSEHADWVGFRMDRYHTWAMGSSTPYRASLFINLHRNGAPTASYDAALKTNERNLNGGADDWKQVARDAQWDIGQGRYTVNLLNEPTWRIKYRAPARRLSMLWQVHQKDWKLDDAKAAMQRMASSLVRSREPDYAEIADRPRRAAEANERKYNAVLAWLAARGYSALQPGVPVTRNGITVELRTDPERRLMVLRLIPAKPGEPLPDYVAYGFRSWSASEGWQDTMPDYDYYPSSGTQRMLNETLAKPGPHHFLIRTIRLDEVDEASYHIADFFEFVSKYR